MQIMNRQHSKPKEGLRPSREPYIENRQPWAKGTSEVLGLSGSHSNLVGDLNYSLAA